LFLRGDTRDAVHARRAASKWMDGVHCRVVDDTLWGNLAAVAFWIEMGPRATLRRNLGRLVRLTLCRPSS
jgi:hypothetical protein